MKLLAHALLGGAATLAVTPALGTASGAFLAATVLMDGDHYLDYLCRNRFRDFSLRRALEFHRLLFFRVREPSFLGLNVLHTVEALGLVAALGVLSGYSWFWAAFWGMVFHMGLDLAYLGALGVPFIRAFSLIEYRVRWRRMVRHGQDPAQPYLATLRTLGADPPGLAFSGQEAETERLLPEETP